MKVIVNINENGSNISEIFGFNSEFDYLGYIRKAVSKHKGVSRDIILAIFDENTPEDALCLLYTLGYLMGESQMEGDKRDD